MQRGEIRFVNFEPALGSEANKRRPAVIVSNDHANLVAERLGRGVLTVVPITSNAARVFPFHVLLSAEDTGLDRDSKAQAEQLRSLSIDRIGEVIGHVPIAKMREVDEAIRLHLGL
ncbi:type II toxin-antitoxin system PemK/MazF family toxin [Leucobacter insecticola]|uniref:mRNA interferase n=1 Tax=Leucobacter insecticola TaxID=2714934 RepID=A0A6G8FHV9_9MICO|nr:type II toxin-antitoxin system PemK/MazF family toxin [Leucobacter insecticola]QIM15938.1 type II toxin-antitoxin system PemK/MazF family toxin [Leucobacter insecticola]